MARVAVVGLFHETNTFAARPTGRAAFEEEGWYRGAELIERYAGSKTVIGGFCDGLAERGHEPIGVFGAFAVPAGRVTVEAITDIREEILTGLRANEPFDAVLVELHGAMVSTESDDPEGDVVAAMRAVVGDRPIAAVTDLHANMTERRLRAVDVLVGYRTNPHIDTWETGRAAARHVDDLLGGAPRPHVVLGTVPVIAPAIGQSTSLWPMAGWVLRAAQLERRHDFVDVTVHGGYAYADVAHAGMAVTITTRGDVAVAEAAVRELCDHGWAMREALVPQLPDAREAVAAAAADSSRPFVLADTGDNINGGSPGTHLGLLEAAAAAGLRCLATWVDPGLLAALRAAPVGAVTTLPAPLARAAGTGTGVKISDFDGRFVNRGPMANGKRMDIGPSAVARIGTVDVLLQGRATQPNDPEMFRAAGLEPTGYDAILLKGASALRAGWAEVTDRFCAVATPGESDSDLRRLHYDNLAGRVWPLVEAPSRSVEVVRLR